jgi:hypothetical protein
LVGPIEPAGAGRIPVEMVLAPTVIFEERRIRQLKPRQSRRSFQSEQLCGAGLLFAKVPSNLCPNLQSGHLVVCFDADYASAKAFARETFFELSLCLAWTKEQDGFCVAKVRDHLVIA